MLPLHFAERKITETLTAEMTKKKKKKSYDFDDHQRAKPMLVHGSTKLWQTRKVNIETKMITYKIKKDNENIFLSYF